jgi:hypothetical protein
LLRYVVSGNLGALGCAPSFLCDAPPGDRVSAERSADSALGTVVAAVKRHLTETAAGAAPGRSEATSRVEPRMATHAGSSGRVTASGRFPPGGEPQFSAVRGVAVG